MLITQIQRPHVNQGYPKELNFAVAFTQEARKIKSALPSPAAQIGLRDVRWPINYNLLRRQILIVAHILLPLQPARL